MSYRYKNLKTKETITTSNKVSGKNWELLEDTTVDISADDIPDEGTVADDIPDEEPAAEEPPIEKPKTTRRGKK